MSCSRFRIEGAVPKDVKKWLTKALKTGAFEPIDPKSDEVRAAGFVQDASLFEGLYALFGWRIEKIRLPASTIRASLAEWSTAFEAKNGRAPGRREKTEQKDLLRKALRAKTQPTTSVSDVSYELPVGEVLVWASSVGVVDEVQAALEKGLEVRLIPRVPASFLSPAALEAMAPTPALFEPVRSAR